MNILIITREAWSLDNNTGNTLANMFGDISKNNSIFNLYFRESAPSNDIAKKTFRISERQILKNLFHKNKCGEYVEQTSSQPINKEYLKEQKTYSLGKKIKSYIPYFIREFIWCFNTWKNSKLKEFIKDINPDVIFMPAFPCWYAYKVLSYLHKISPKSRIFLFHADDCYSLKQFSFFPSFWLYRLIQRKWIRKSISFSSVNYVISRLQKAEYDRAFKIDTKLLTKCENFSNNEDIIINKHKPLRIVYTGNLHLNRYKSLSLIVKSLETINFSNRIAELYIYSGTELTNKMKKALQSRFCFLMGKISASEVVDIQNGADVLVHVESFDLKNKLATRLSFSTKIVDYLFAGKPILAVGPSDVASIQTLKEYQCAMVCQNVDEISSQLLKCINEKDYMLELAKNGYKSGLNYHNKNTILKMLETDICNTTNIDLKKESFR